MIHRSVRRRAGVLLLLVVGLAPQSQLLERTYYEGLVPYSRTGSGGWVRADDAAQAEIRRLAPLRTGFGIAPFAPAGAVALLRGAIPAQLSTDPTAPEIWEAARVTLNWLYEAVDPRASYLDIMEGERWPDIETIARYWARHGRLGWSACFSKAHLAFQLFRLVGLPTNDFGIAQAHYRDAAGRETPTHVYLGLRVAGEWVYIDPATQRDLGPYRQRQSIGANFAIDSGPGVDYRHPYSFITVGGPGGFVGVPLLGRPDAGNGVTTERRATSPPRAPGGPAPAVAPLTDPPSATSATVPVSPRGGARVYLVEPGGLSRERGGVGCGDRIVAVEVPSVDADDAAAALTHLLDQGSRIADREGLYDALARATLRLHRIDLKAPLAEVHLGGRLVLGGACDAPRVREQIERTVRQVAAVETVRVYVNGVALSALLAER